MTACPINLTSPGGIEALLAYHRSVFGDARMETEPAPPAAPAAPDAPTPAPPTEPSPAPPAAGSAPAEPTKVEELPDWAQKLIRDTRTEAATNRTAKTEAETRQQELLDGIAQALGLKKDDAPPDPNTLQQTLAEREGRIATAEIDLRAKDVELAAWRSASQQGANAVALLDSRSFVSAIGKLDPTADDFTKQLDAAVKTAIESNPALRATPVPTPGQAGIGVSGLSPAATAQPGLDRVRQAYASSGS